MQTSIIRKSDIDKAKRFDAEYFKPEYLRDDFNLEQTGYYVLSAIADVKGGKRLPLGENFSEEGVPYIRAEDIKNGFVDYENVPKISYALHKKLKRYQTKKNDILLTIVGSVGAVGFVQFDIDKCNLTENAAKITDITKVNPSTTFIYFLSKFGQNQIHREKVGTIQEKLALDRIRRFKIAKFNNSFQLQIEKLVKEAYQKQEQSKKLYREAEDMLLEELGLLDYKPKHRLTFTARKSGVDKAGRFDAEYFQPFYQEINKRIYKNGSVSLQRISEMINYGSVPTSPYTESEIGVPYIKGLNLKNLTIDISKLDRITDTNGLPKKVFTEEGDIIISQMGTVGDVGVVGKGQEGWIFASFTIRVRLKQNSGYIPEYIGLFIQNIAKKYYLMRNIAQASVRQNTDLPTIKNMPIPKLPLSVQTRLADKITESHKLRKESKQLLEEAKRKVEEEIEKHSL